MPVTLQTISIHATMYLRILTILILLPLFSCQPNPATDETAAAADTYSPDSAAAMTIVPLDEVVNDTIYDWDETLYEWVPAEPGAAAALADTTKIVVDEQARNTPKNLKWPTLTDIRYCIKYFAKVDMQSFAPIFPAHIRALDGAMVRIKGYVIPLDETGETIALSSNSFASCFFCGQASPATVISMRLAESGKRYEMDEQRTFTGRLRLNHDNPDEFYYILEEAK